jgi:hypothetical protein
MIEGKLAHLKNRFSNRSPVRPRLPNIESGEFSVISIMDMNESRSASKSTINSIKPYSGGEFRVRRD